LFTKTHAILIIPVEISLKYILFYFSDVLKITDLFIWIFGLTCLFFCNVLNVESELAVNMAVIMAVGIFREELLFEWDSCFARLYSMQYIRE